MNTLVKKIVVALLCGALVCPMVEARGRNNGGNQQQQPQRTQQQSPSRSGNNARPGNSGNNTRPGNSGQNNSGRPGNSGWGNNTPSQVRPGNNGNQRPGNQPGMNNGNQRPGNHPGMNNGNQRPGNHPGNNWNFGAPGMRPGPGPAGPAFGGVPQGRPARPLLPPPAPYRRPVRPAGWVYSGGGPIINTILGVAIGTAIGATISNLINSGYNVTGYGDDAIYVADAMQLNLLWPNATLYYGAGGGLVGSEFFYSTPYYDMNRYNLAYNRLYNAYGAPISRIALAGGGVQTTWWGPGGNYVQLQFNSGVASNGSTRFYTTLSFGN